MGVGNLIGLHWHANEARGILRERLLLGEDVSTEIFNGQGKRYALVRSLGRGGYGETFFAFCSEDEITCAVKKQLVGNPDKWIHEWVSHHMSRNEGPKSRHVLAIYDAFEFRGSRYIVLEHAEGTLADFFKLPTYHGPEWLMPAHGLLGGLGDIHIAGAYHGDITADNVFVQDPSFLAQRPSEYAIKIGDFGEAGRWDDGGKWSDPTKPLGDVERAARVLVETWIGRRVDPYDDLRAELETMPARMRSPIETALRNGYDADTAATDLLAALELAVERAAPLS